VKEKETHLRPDGHNADITQLLGNNWSRDDGNRIKWPVMREACVQQWNVDLSQ